MVQVDDPLADLDAGDLDVAVAASAVAYPATASPAQLRAISGYQNYDAAGGYAGSVLMAQQALIWDEPGTVIAFLSAYIRALQDLADPEGAAEALDILQGTDLAVDPAIAADWTGAVAAYAPFDGGFGSLDDGEGLGELNALLGGNEDTALDFSTFIAADPLAVAQAWLELPANPFNRYIGAPGLSEISVGLPMNDGAPSPVVVADDAGLFAEAGFEFVELLDVEQPLPGVLSGQIDFAVIDAVDAADGVAQGLPLRVIAGHANYSPDGEYGGDVIVVSTDLLENEPSTAAAFLIAYLQGLERQSDSVNATIFAAHDGGFGSRETDGGLAELRDYLVAELGAEPDMETLIAAAPLHFAQSWSGTPVNPTVAPVPTEES